MIKIERYKEINDEIIKSIKNTFNDLCENSLQEFILFLANAEYVKEYEGTKLSPYTIDYRLDIMKDTTRLEFLVAFLKSHYSFPCSIKKIKYDFYRMNLELMIYTHIWESKPYLKKLYRLSKLVNEKKYEWKCEIPDMSKHDFIRNVVRKNFENQKNDISEIIEKGFHTSLRNAFAHSEYGFDTMNGNNRIVLLNHKGKSWELKEISFDEWSERFVYSALLSYHLLNFSFKRKEIIKSKLSNKFTIKIPSIVEKEENIIYKESSDEFLFERNLK